MAATMQRPKTSPRRPTATSRPPLSRPPIECQRMDVAATTGRGLEDDILRSQGSPRFPASERQGRETRKIPGYAIDCFAAGEGRLKGGHWERGSHERETFSPSRDRENSPPNAWIDNNGRTSRVGRKTGEERRVYPTFAPFRDHWQGNVVEKTDNYYEDDFKVVSARGSYQYVFVPWGHTLVPKPTDGIGKPVPPREGRQQRRHDGRRSRAADSHHHEGTTTVTSCSTSSDKLWRNDRGVDADNVLDDHSDSWKGGRRTRSTQCGGGASSWREWNRSEENGSSVFQTWDKVIQKARGHRKGHVFEHLWIEYGNNTGEATSTEAHPGGSSAAQGDNTRNVSPSLGGNLSADRVGSQVSIRHERKDEPSGSVDENGQVSAPQSEGGSSLYDVLLSDGSNSNETWSMGSLEQNETAEEVLKAREAGGASALNGPSGSSIQQRSSPRPRFGGVGGSRTAPALVASSSDGSSLYDNFSHGSHATVSNERTITVNDPYVPRAPSTREKDQHDVVLRAYAGSSAGLAGSGPEEEPARSPSDTQTAHSEGQAEQTAGDSLPHLGQHSHAEQQDEIGVRGAFDEHPYDTSVKRLSQPDDKRLLHESLTDRRKLDGVATAGNYGGERWAKEDGGASQGTLLESQQSCEPVPFVAKPRQRRLERRMSTGDRELDKHALARHAVARSIGHRALSLGSLVDEHNEGSFGEALVVAKDAQMARPEGHAEQTTGKSLDHVGQHAYSEQHSKIEVRRAFNERPYESSTKRLSQPDDKRPSHESLFDTWKLDGEAPAGNDGGGRWGKEHDGASQGTLLGSKQPCEPVPFIARPRQRQLDRRRSTGDGVLDKRVLARHAVVRSKGHRAMSLGSLVNEHNRGSFDESLLAGKPRLGSNRDDGRVNDQQASEGTGEGSSVEDHGRAVEEQTAEGTRLIDDFHLEGNDARAPVGEDTPAEVKISAGDEGLAHSRSLESKARFNIEGKEKVEVLSLDDETSGVGRDKSLVGERPPSGETPASDGEHSDGRKRGPDTRDEDFVDKSAPGDNLSPPETRHRQALEEGSHLDEGSHLEAGSNLEEDTALARGLGAVGGGLRVTDRELGKKGKKGFYDEISLNDMQHKQTLEGRGDVGMGARDVYNSASESLRREGGFENVRSLGRVSPLHEPHRASIDEDSLDERGRFSKEVPPAAEGSTASELGLADRTEGGDDRVTESMHDKNDALKVSDTLRQEEDDQRKLVAEKIAEIVVEIAAVDGERGDSEGGGDRSVNESELKSREAFDETPLEGQPRPDLLNAELADGRPLDDRRPAEYPSAQQALDSKPSHGSTSEELVAGNAEVDGRSTHHEVPVPLEVLAEEKPPPDDSKDDNVGVGETLSSAAGEGGVTTYDKLDTDATLDELASLDKEQEPHGLPAAQHRLLDEQTPLAGEFPDERPFVDERQTQLLLGGGDLFDGSERGRSSDSAHDSAATKHPQPEGEGALDEYLFDDAGSSGNHSLDRSSFDGQSLSDHDSEDEASFGGSSPGTGSAGDDVSAVDDDVSAVDDDVSAVDDDVSAVDDDLLFDDG